MKNFRPAVLLSFLALFISLLLGTSIAAPKKTNVVFILSDNHGAWTLGCYGNKDIRTPHIDKMATEGFASPMPLQTTQSALPPEPLTSPA